MIRALDRVDYSPIIDRPPITWPGGARVAFWVSPNVEHYEYRPAPDGKRDPYPRSPHPDIQQYAYYDYGNRVGFWRMLEVLDKYAVRCTVSLNLGVLDHFPEIKAAMIERDWEYMSHGVYNTQYITTLSETEERNFIADNIASLASHTGKRLKGFFGPSFTGTERTPDLLAEAGILYHCDWVHDDQPVPIKVDSGRLISVPYSAEINDGVVLRTYCDGDYFARICMAQFDQLYREGADSGRVMCIALHPFLIGQPHRAQHLDRALDYILSHDGVWATTADEVAEYYLAHHYDAAVAHRAGAEV